MSIEKDRERYARACHAMQTGVAAKGGPELEPKHLRTGINSAMVETSVLAHLLIEKGIFTMEEFVTALANGMEAEVASYEAELGVRLA